MKIAVGLSGGVDSAVAAALLQKQGHSVCGITMRIWNNSLPIPTGAKSACFGPDEDEEVAACEKLCAKLGIQYRTIDLSAEYEATVLEYFKREYRAGRTPNPCIVCNSEIKFGFLVSRAHSLGLDFDYFATGHYARITQGQDGILRLQSALDTAKDQTYFLYRLGSEALRHVLFPLGQLSKPEVRDIAREIGLELAEKAESQDFIAGGDYSSLFADRPPEAGDIVDGTGQVLGRHRGLPFYTIGQRKGLGIGASVDSHGEAQALYVLALDAKQNRVIVGPNNGLFAEGATLSDFVSYGSPSPGVPIRGHAKIRQNHRPVACSFVLQEDFSCVLDFDTSQRAIAPGQSAVIYDDQGIVLGGGIIEKARIIS